MAEPSSFLQRLNESWQHSGSLLCVGLDPVAHRIPSSLGSGLAAVEAFCRGIVVATGDLVCAFKPQIAHFSALGAERVLENLIRFMHHEFPTVPVILDAKRGDIGSTAALYAQECFDRYQADAVTLNPFLGAESLEPFLTYPGKGVVILCRTSNPGSDWLQDYPAEDPLFLRIARRAKSWNRYDNVMLVAAATQPKELALIRQTVGHMPLLVPGIGAQGGELTAVLQAGLYQGAGLVINCSRSILYASDAPGSHGDGDYQSNARDAAQRLRSEINAGRAKAATSLINN